MDATSSRTAKATALDVAHLLEQHQAERIVVLGVGSICSWTDYFVIATPRSETHMRSLLDRVLSTLDDRSVVPLNGNRQATDSGWALIDCGDLIVHLMDREKRAFYELEKLWFAAEQIYSSSESFDSSSS